MNCKNCGAPLHLIREKDYYFCEHCGTFHFPDPNRDGVRVLGEPGNVKCPVCREPSVVGAVEGSRVLHCNRCKGILIRQWVFRTVIRYLRTEAAGPEVAPRPVDPKDLQRKLYCPVCGQQLDTHPYYGPGNVVIDTCGNCQLIWLDYGELYRIVSAAGPDRGRQL